MKTCGQHNIVTSEIVLITWVEFSKIHELLTRVVVLNFNLYECHYLCIITIWMDGFYYQLSTFSLEANFTIYNNKGIHSKFNTCMLYTLYLDLPMLKEVNNF